MVLKVLSLNVNNDNNKEIPSLLIYVCLNNIMRLDPWETKWRNKCTTLQL